jgi:O-antigen/teichoic acid export membrane protein
VFRNATLLLIAQAVATPISILVNAISARTLGAVSFGRLYQAGTFASFIFLFVEWGQGNVLMAKVARHPASAGELLGSGIVFRVLAGSVAAVAVPIVCVLAGYDREFILIMFLMLLCGILVNVSSACQDVFRGFERMDFAAASYVAWQVLTASAAIPTLLLGGGSRGLLIAQTACALVGTLFVLKMTPRMQVPPLRVTLTAVRELIKSGRPFLLFALVLTLQPLVDVAMLSKFSAPEGMGWYAAARKLVGVLTYPASVLVIALYPTLCRLHLEDMAAFRSTAADAFYAVIITVAPASLSCALFPDLGVAIFGERYFGPAEDDLRMLAPYLFLVYFSMPIGSCLASSGRQSGWTAVQFACVVVSALCDPPLIRWFQAHTGNGGLGVCVAAVASELLMVIGGSYLLPKGVLQQIPRRKLVSALCSGAVMVLVALSLARVEVILRASLALLAYVLCLQLSGGMNLMQLRSFLGVLRKR